MIFSIVLFVVVVVLGVGTFFSNKVMYPKVLSYEETKDRNIASFLIDEAFLKDLDYESIFLESYEGYKLHGWWIQHESPIGTMIVIHGITCTLYDSLKYAKFLMALGYNVLVYDQKYHGKSGGDFSSFGYEEKFDLRRMVDFVLEKSPETKVVGTLGESMGAATVLQHAAIDPRIDFVIADCSYKSTFDILKYRLKVEYHLPAFPILEIASMINHLKTGTSYRSISPMDAVMKTTTPILFIHGDADTYVPASHSIEMYETSKDIGHRELLIIEGAKHARSYQIAPVLYQDRVEAFIEHCRL